MVSIFWFYVPVRVPKINDTHLIDNLINEAQHISDFTQLKFGIGVSVSLRHKAAIIAVFYCLKFSASLCRTGNGQSKDWRVRKHLYANLFPSPAPYRIHGAGY